MIPATFTYHVPATITEASALLVQYGDDAKILSGGQSLIPLMKLRLASPQHIIDINRVPGLEYVREDQGVLRLGALARESDLDESDLVRTRYPILHDTSRVIADPLVRNLATVCGNLAHADPANDHPATMLALGAEVVAVGPGGERRLPIGTFFVGPLHHGARPRRSAHGDPDSRAGPRSGGAYQKLERKVGDFATAGTAVQVTLAADGTCERVGIGLTNVGGTPIQATRAEAFLRGKRPDDAAIAETGRLAAEEADPTEDGRGSVAYKRDLVRVLTARALRQALARAGGGR